MSFSQDFDNPWATRVYQIMRIVSPLLCAGTAVALWIKVGHKAGLSLFAWHPWLMTFGWFICVAYGLLSFKARRRRSHANPIAMMFWWSGAIPDP